MIPHHGRNFIGVAKFVLRDEVIAGTSEDYDLVVSVSGDVTESMSGIAMRLEVPDDRTVIGVKGELQDAVAALHSYVLIFVRVLLEFAHRRFPRGSGCPCPNLLLSKNIGKRVWRFEWPLRPSKIRIADAPDQLRPIGLGGHGGGRNRRV